MLLLPDCVVNVDSVEVFKNVQTSFGPINQLSVIGERAASLTGTGDRSELLVE